MSVDLSADAVGVLGLRLDRFGVRWMFNCYEAAGRTISPQGQPLACPGQSARQANVDVDGRGLWRHDAAAMSDHELRGLIHSSLEG